MATVTDWNKFINLTHELALIEDNLRTTVATGNQRAAEYAKRLLWEHFGVDG